MRKLVTVMFLVLVACGSDAVSLDGYPDAIRDARCRHLVKCGEVESVDACRKANTGELGGDVALPFVDASVRAAVDKGMTKYDGDNVQACLDAFADRSCDVTSQSARAVPDACLKVLSGTQGDGAACALDTECRSQQCDVPDCDMACCPGTCVGDASPVRAKLGESCEVASCEANLFCDGAVLMCVALKPVDAFCALAEECAFGLDCLPSAVCGALPGPGGPCMGACRDEGTTCSPTSHTCVEVALAGEACATSADCSPVYVCDATKHCSKGLGLGAACTATEHCGDDRAFCDIPEGEAMGNCALPKANGSSCRFDSDCESANCDPGSLLCGPEPVCI